MHIVILLWHLQHGFLQRKPGKVNGMVVLHHMDMLSLMEKW